MDPMEALNAGVKRSLDDAEAIIGGKRQALGEVDLGMSSSLKILIANKSAGSIIGKAGATINAIKENSGARVKVSSSTEVFPGTNDRIVLIQGTARRASRCRLSTRGAVSDREELRIDFSMALRRL